MKIQAALNIFCFLIRLLVISGFMFTCSTVSGQTGIVLQEIKAGFDQFQQVNLREKLFVHTDKNFYLAGELLWFKMYMVDGTFHKPLDMSKVAYLELLDRNNKPVIQTKIELKDGSGNGSVYLPVSISSGNYQLRAYTGWMKNFSPELYFNRSVTIVNTLRETEPVLQQKSEPVYSIHFFPEGGNLVQGLKSKIAFQALDRNGRGMDCEGVILDRQDTVARFKTLKFGIGSLPFTPKAGKNYMASISLPDGRFLTQQLPPVLNDGYVLRVQDVDSSTVKATVSLASLAAESVYLLVHAGQQVRVVAQTQVNNGVAEFMVSKSKLKEGVSVFTIFNQKKQPVCERLYYTRNQERLTAGSLKTDRQEYGSRKKVMVDVQVPGIGGNADLSLSVYRLDSLEQTDHPSISDYFNLSSELKGTIESPGYYLKNANAETNEALDNVMLCHGWRKFSWDAVFQNRAPLFKFLPEYSGHIIMAKITDRQTGASISNNVSYLASPGRRIQLYTAQSNAEGMLKFYTRDFYGINKLIIQSRLKEDSVYRWSISSPFSSEFTTPTIPVYTARHDMDRLLYSRNMNVQVQNSFYGEKMSRFYAPQTDSIPFYGKATKEYQLDDYTRFATMEEVLREYILEIGVNVQRKNYSLKVSDYRNKGFYSNEPLILLDGVPVFHTNKIIQFNPLKVKSIAAVTNRHLAGPAYFEGIARFSTYTGDLAGFELNPSATILDYEGLQLQRVFHSPDYSTESQVQGPLPDFRDLLYWNPSIKLKNSGVAKLAFYTADQTGTYRLVLQGISADGSIISKTAEFDVKNERD